MSTGNEEKLLVGAVLTFHFFLKVHLRQKKVGDHFSFEKGALGIISYRLAWNWKRFNSLRSLDLDETSNTNSLMRVRSSVLP